MRGRRRRPRTQAGQLSDVLRLLLAADALVVGGGYLLGPAAWRSSGTLAVIRDLGVPIPVWGAVFVACGALLAAGLRTAGHVAAAATYGFWGSASLATAATGQLVAWGNPWHTLALAGVHVLAVWRRSSAKAKARTG